MRCIGAVAGREEATCRAIGSLILLQEAEYRTEGSAGRYGSCSEAKQLAISVLGGSQVAESRSRLDKYFLEALRLQPQGEVLLSMCAHSGARVADSRPILAGRSVFVSHGPAMREVPEAGAFRLDRPRKHCPQCGWKCHTCLGEYVSPVSIVETMISLLGLEGLRRPEPRAGESAFPSERRPGRLQLDDRNLYATMFVLQFADTGTTRRYWP